MEMDENFYESDAGQIIAGAHKYLSAARLLRDSEIYDARPTLLHTPTLHLVGHGIELLLKFPLMDYLEISEIRSTYGHDLIKLWNADENAILRENILSSAEIVWADAEASGSWPDDFRKSPREEIIQALTSLAPLHSRESDFALRYIAPVGTTAPRPAFLIDVFGRVAERAVMNPQILLRP